MRHYTYRAEWWPESGVYIAKCLELPFIRHRAPTAPEAVAGAEKEAQEHLEHLREAGGDAPDALGDRNYSGNFLVRTSPALHARLTIEAAEQGVSLNKWVAQRLAERPSIGLFDY